MSQNSTPPVKAVRGGAAFVAAGIFLSRIAGLVRVRVFAHYFGSSEAADAFNSALKIPNFLQNLFGEGVLSASFIPVYARLLGEKRSVEADRVAGVIATLLALVTSLLALIGVFAAPHMVAIIAPGFVGAKRELTVTCVQILFPSVALLVMSAWCLGVLNSHRRFFLSYVAPVVWNGALIATLIAFGGRQPLDQLAKTACWGLVAGSFFQFAVQFPTVLKLAPDLKFSLQWASDHVRSVLTSFSSVVIGRGVVQISAYIDLLIASWLPTGAVAVLTYAQTIYLLPISLFGMSVSAANLPEMSRDRAADGGGEAANEKLRAHLERGLRQIAYFIVPSTAALVFLGDVVAAAIFQTGKFAENDVRLVWMTLAGSGVGLLATTFGRLYSSTFYAMQDAKTPLRFALVRVAMTSVLGYIGGLHLPGWLGLDASWGTAGLTSTAGIAGWIELGLLRRSLNRRIGHTGTGKFFLTRLWIPALAAAAGGWGVKWGAEIVRESHRVHPAIVAVFVFGVFGVIYLAGTLAAGVPQAREVYLGVRRKVLRR
ncbi:MAG: murein biosynthesis integral membrane protein MurJ [Luteolibacter sp.]